MAETQASVSEREFRHWQAKFAREPDGIEQMNWWMAQMLSVLVNVNRSKGSRPIDAEDLIPDPWGEREASRKSRPVFKGRELDAVLRAWAGG